MSCAGARPALAFMSPLARSLLALICAALLHAACADAHHSSHCSYNFKGQEVGCKNIYDVRVRHFFITDPLPYYVHELDIPITDYCYQILSPRRRASGDDGIHVIVREVVMVSPPVPVTFGDDFSPVTVPCPDDGDCGPFNVTVYQYCKLIG